MVDLGLREGSAAHQYLAQAQAVFRQLHDVADVVGDVAVWRQDAQLAFVGNEVEDVLDVGFRSLGLQADFKTEITGFRVHFFSGRNRVADGFDADDFAEVAEIADEGERVHAAPQDVAAKAHRDVPAVVVDYAATAAFDFDSAFMHGQGGVGWGFLRRVAGFKDFS